VLYYNKLFDKIGFKPDKVNSISNLKYIPTLTKQEVQDNFEKLISDEFRTLDVHLDSTGGSTGTPLNFYVDKFSSIVEWATIWRHWNWAGYRFGQKVCDLRGRVFEPDDVKPWKMNYRFRILNISSFHLTDENMTKYYELVTKYRPVLLRGYPSSLNIFAQFLENNNLLGIKPKAVITSAESLLDYQRENIENAFQCKVYDWYGMGERTIVVSECPKGGFHLNSEYGIARLINNGKDVFSGEVGEIVTTNLNNFVMPLINYKTDDLAVMSDELCPCGRGLPLVSRIIGRVEDVIIGPDGRRVGRLDAAFRYIKGVRISQIVQKSLDEIEVRLVVDGHLTDTDERKLVEQLRNRLGTKMKIKFQIVGEEEIERSTSGKIKFVISHLTGGDLESRGIRKYGDIQISNNWGDV